MQSLLIFLWEIIFNEAPDKNVDEGIKQNEISRKYRDPMHLMYRHSIMADSFP